MFGKIRYGSSTETENMTNAARYSKCIDGNLRQRVQNIRLGRRFSFQHDNAEQTRTMLEWLWVESLNGPTKVQLEPDGATERIIQNDRCWGLPKNTVIMSTHLQHNTGSEYLSICLKKKKKSTSVYCTVAVMTVGLILFYLLTVLCFIKSKRW